MRSTCSTWISQYIIYNGIPILISLEFIHNESLYFMSTTHKDLIIFILEKVTD